MSIDFKDISVIVQGPVQAYQGREQQAGITHQCLQSIRTHLPGATIILSTWEGQDCSGLEPDILLLNKDPGGTIAAYDQHGKPGKLNFNRQLLSTAAGLRQARTPYAIKLRSDNYLTGNEFVTAQQAYPVRNQADSLFTERVVVNTSYFRKYADGQRVVMLPSDFFHFGRTEDLLKIWGIPLFDDLVFNPSQSGRPQYRGYPYIIPHAEQIYCNAWLQQLDKQVPYLEHRHQQNTAMVEYWDRFMASNFVVMEPEQIGLGLIPRFIAKQKRPNEMSYLDWQCLYQHYCDANFVAPKLKLFTQLGWKRLVKLPFSRLKFSIKHGKRHK